MQTVLHALFLPTPFKVLSQSSVGTMDEKSKNTKGSPIDSSVIDMPEEVLKPGALYADCAVVRLKVPLPPSAVEQRASEKETVNDGETAAEVLDIQDDGEFGGELMGRLVWEAYEEALKDWEKANPPVEEVKEVAPDVDRDHD